MKNEENVNIPDDVLSFLTNYVPNEEKQYILNNTTQSGRKFLVRGVQKEAMIKKIGKKVKLEKYLEYYIVENGTRTIPSESIVIKDGKEYVFVPAYPSISNIEKVKIDNKEVPDFSSLEKFGASLLIQEKVDGYNVRLVYVNEKQDYFAFLRGGVLCTRTTWLLHENNELNNLLMNFFSANKDLIPFVECVGRLSLNTNRANFYKEKYGIGDIGFFVFDIFKIPEQKNKFPYFLKFKDLFDLMNKANFNIVPTRMIDKFNEVVASQLLKQLDEFAMKNTFEGFVVKEDAEKYVRFMLKIRYDNLMQYVAKSKKQAKYKKINPKVLFNHFIQGYPEKPHLMRGVSRENLVVLRKYEKEIEDLIVANKDFGSRIKEASKWLANAFYDALDNKIKKQISYNEIEKICRAYFGKLVGLIKRKKSIH